MNNNQLGSTSNGNSGGNVSKDKEVRILFKGFRKSVRVFQLSDSIPQESLFEI